MKNLATLVPAACAAFFLSASASAQLTDIGVVLEGQVVGQVGLGLFQGPFQQVQSGEAVRLSIAVITPGQVGPVESFFDVDTHRIILEMGGARYDGSFGASASLLVGNDRVFPQFPQVDYLVGFLNMPLGQSLEISVEDGLGQMFSSNDLSQMVGTYATPGASRVWLTEPNGIDGIEVDLTLMEILPLGPVGTVFCAPPHPNSHGQPALMSGYGSPNVSAQRLEMEVVDLPIQTFGLLLVGDQQSVILNPGGSQGDLCIAGGSIGRFTDQVAVVQNGTARFTIDLSALPQPMGTTPVVAGQTWNFQTWYRDLNPGQTTNYTNPVSVTFQ